MINMNVVSLFSGAGGFDWGLHLASDFVTYLANELRLAPATTLANNLGMRLTSSERSYSAEDGRVVIQGDVADLDFSSFVEILPDVVIGGPPCQDFSVVKGSVRKGVEVKRGRLYSHFVRALVALQPKVFVFENVPGLLSANNRIAYEMMLEDFSNLNMRWQEIREEVQIDNCNGNRERIGYEILFSGIVDASRLGVPQKRRRLLIIGLRQDIAEELGLFKVQNLRTLLNQELSGIRFLFSKYPLTCIEVFEGKPLCELDREYREVMMAYEGIWNEVSTPLASTWRTEVWERLSFDVLKDYMWINNIQDWDRAEIDKAMSEHAEVLAKLGYFGTPVRNLNLKDGSNSVPPQSVDVAERLRRIPPGMNNQFVAGTNWEVEGRGLSLIYRRAFPLRPAPTVVAYGGGGTWGYHYERERGVLSNRERARLQTFTDDFLFVGTLSEVRAQIGEAVPPLLAARVGRALLEVQNLLSGERTKGESQVVNGLSRITG